MWPIEFILDLLVGINQRLEERALRKERARREQIREGRKQLMEELQAAEKARKDN